MREIINLLSPILLANFNPLSKSKGSAPFIRLTANLGAFFLLIFGYILGCRALYYYLEPTWGEVLSLLALCVLLMVTSFLLFLVGWFLKPKNAPVADFMSAIEKIVSEVPSNEIVKKIVSHVSPKTLISIFAIVALGSYFANFKKKDI